MARRPKGEQLSCLTLMGFDEWKPKIEVTRVVMSPEGDLYLEMDTQPIEVEKEGYYEALLEAADAEKEWMESISGPGPLETREAQEGTVALPQVHSPTGRTGADDVQETQEHASTEAVERPDES